MTTATIPVSIVIPFFGGHATIQRALASIDAQTSRPEEIVVVDDGSPEPFRPGDVTSLVPLRHVAHPENRGIAAARNTGIAAAGGAWIGFLDQDDEWEAGKLARQWAVVEREELADDVVVFGRLFVETGVGAPHLRPPRRAIGEVEAGGARAIRAFLHHGNVVPLVTVLAPRGVFERYGAFDETLRGGADDTELVLRLIAEGVRFRFDDDPGASRWSVAHRHTGRNYSDHAPRWVADQLAFLPRLADRYPVMRPLLDRFLARARYTLGRHHERAGDDSRAAAEYGAARRLDPRWVRPWLARARLAAPAPVRRAAGWVWERRREARRERPLR